MQEKLEEKRDQPELAAISSLVFWDTERRWEEIAQYVREGCSDPQFLAVLRRTLDPRINFRDITLIVRRPKGRPKKLTRTDEAHVLFDLLRTKHRERWALEMIADQIEAEGLQDERLREGLADMFSRLVQGPHGMRFELEREVQGKPRRFLKREAQNFLDLHSELFGEKTSEVTAAASAKFKLSEETARNYLKDRRRCRKTSCEDWETAFERKTAFSMREQGYAEYQTLSEIMNNTDL